MSDKKPLEWIRLELVPLPHYEDRLDKVIVFWNPDTGELKGQSAQALKSFIDESAGVGSITTAKGEVIEFDNPYTNTAAFSTILSQRYWVSPQPVEVPEEPEENIQ